MQTKLTKKEIIKVLSHMQIMKSKDSFSFFFFTSTINLQVS